jgi:hypothetical protein
MTRGRLRSMSVMRVLPAGCVLSHCGGAPLLKKKIFLKNLNN